MREAWCLDMSSPTRSSQPQGNRINKHQLIKLIKKGSTSEVLGEDHA